MRTIARRGAAVSLLLWCVAAFAQAEKTPWMSVLAKLASALSQNDAVGALENFDSAMKDYGSIEQNLTALAAQADVLCSIDAIEEREDGDGRLLDVDWYMQLKAQSREAPVERRRERVRIGLRRLHGKWKIVSLTPINILDPIHLK